jgi:hypothetical protein
MRKVPGKNVLQMNHEPALLYYKYGQGTVFLTSLFTDYAYSRSMAGTQGIKLVKNLVRFAMDPDAMIPMFNLDEDPNPSINLNIKITNHSENTAANARISVYTIAGTLIYQIDAPVSLNKDESAEIPVTFTIPTLEDNHLGIGYTLYQLEDASGQVIRMEKETPGGRFALYKPIEPAGIAGGLFQWITVKSEIVYYGQELECRIYLKNETEQTRSLEFAGRA